MCDPHVAGTPNERHNVVKPPHLSLAMFHPKALVDALASMDEDASVEQQLTPATVEIPDEGPLPLLTGATGWLNSSPLSAAGLRGKIILVQFWTYTCINWLRTLPYVRAWAEKYKEQGLVVVGVHTPEFPFEHDVENVRQAIREMKIEYPIALDNEYAIWNAFDNHYWPALYFVDARGNIRRHHFGEGNYEQSEVIIQRLLVDAGIGDVYDGLVSVEAGDVEAAADWDNLKSMENYVGYARTENFASPGGAALDAPHVYTIPSRLKRNHWSLAGEWTIQEQTAVLNAPNGQIVYRFHARDLHLVMGPATRGTPVHFRVRIDGQTPDVARGSDIDAMGNGIVTEQRLYQLIRQSHPIVDRQFEIAFLDAGVEVYAFTFG
jgi:thiol-disulfide isomerase/thioredoxin